MLILRLAASTWRPFEFQLGSSEKFRGDSSPSSQDAGQTELQGVQRRIRQLWRVKVSSSLTDGLIDWLGGKDKPKVMTRRPWICGVDWVVKWQTQRSWFIKPQSLDTMGELLSFFGVNVVDFSSQDSILNCKLTLISWQGLVFLRLQGKFIAKSRLFLHNNWLLLG